MSNVVVIRWGGTTWRRYPNAKQRNHRVYFAGYVGGVQTTLHRAKWEAKHGPIPAGCEIHHKDGDPLNNRIGNLECLTCGDHRRKEAAVGSFSTPKARAHLDRVRPLTKAWHASEAGRRWHAENAKQAMATRKVVGLTCRQCGNAFESKHAFAMYCSQRCNDAARPPRQPVHDLQCERCGNTFKAMKAGQRYCSGSCRSKAFWAQWRAAK